MPEALNALDKFSLKLVLASTSPRRKELLSYLGVEFQVVSPQTEEKQRAGEDALAYARRNSLEKAEAVYGLELARGNSQIVVIGADTIGLLDDKVLEKPKDTLDAIRMLSEMSGRSHRVLTAVSLVGGSASAKTHKDSFLVETLVHFKKLSPGEIQYYVNTKEPLDKAGAYGIQGIGGFIVRAIEGSYSNVVGLPLVELSDALKRWPN